MSEHSSDVWVDKYEASVQEASKAYMSQKYSVALKNYTEALKIAKNYQSGEKFVCILRYMIACCLVESDKWDDLAEAVMILQLIDLGAKKRFPAIYGIMARAHYKLFRFKEALNAIVAGEKILSSTPKNLLQEFYIPGTNIAIEQDKEAESWKKVKAACSTFHQADAICFSKSCINIIKPYTDANRNIFKKDPAFNGMVIVTCDNHQPCTCVYHPTCWKAQKDLICPLKKVSDRDMLGHACFVENCSYNNICSVITDIEIIGANGKTKTHIKPPGSESLQEYSKDGRIELRGSRQESILVLNGKCDIEVDFSNDNPVIAQNKKILLEVFESYILRNIVTVDEAYAKYEEEYSELFQLGANLDILSFLLSTGRVKIMDDKTRMPTLLSQNDHVSGEITEDSYSAIMSDNDKSSVGKPNKKCELKNFNVSSNVIIVYDTGSCTGSIRDNASTESKDTYKRSEATAPVTKPDEYQQKWKNVQERFKSFFRAIGSWQHRWDREGNQRQQQPLPFERAAESYQHQQPTPFQRTAESYEHQQQRRPTPYERAAKHHEPWQREAHPAPAPLQRQPAETYRQPWEKEESRPSTFKKPADTYKNLRRDTIHPAPFKKPAETYGDWRRGRNEARPAPFKKPWERNETYPPPLMRPSDKQETKWMGSNDECSICTLKFYKNDVYTLNCGHSFHINCAKSWFKTQRTCPNCRT